MCVRSTTLRITLVLLDDVKSAVTRKQTYFVRCAVFFNLVINKTSTMGLFPSL